VPRLSNRIQAGKKGGQFGAKGILSSGPGGADSHTISPLEERNHGTKIQVEGRGAVANHLVGDCGTSPLLRVGGFPVWGVILAPFGRRPSG